MWYKEWYEGRWRIGIMNLIAYVFAVSFPFLFRLVQHSPQKLPSRVSLILHQYPAFAYSWFTETLPELLLVYVLILVVGAITREWQSGTIEFLGQIPQTPGCIAGQKGLWGMMELSFLAFSSSAILWLVSRWTGHALRVDAFILAVLLTTIGIVAFFWLMSWLAWLLHSTYTIIVIGIGLFIISLLMESVPLLHAFSLFTYITNQSAYQQGTVPWEHLGLCVAAAVGFGLITIRVANRQEFIPTHGRDQR